MKRVKIKYISHIKCFLQIRNLFSQGVGVKGVTSLQTDPVKNACLALFFKFGKEVAMHVSARNAES